MSVLPETNQKEILESIDRVSSNADKWHGLAAKEKLHYLYLIRSIAESLFDEWTNASNDVRSLSDPLFQGVGAVAGPGLFGSHLNSWIDSYESLVSTGALPKPTATRKLGHTEIVQVYPYTFIDTVAAGGLKIELYMEDGKPATQGADLKNKPSCVTVFGGGNVEAPVDVLSKMFGNGSVVVWKAHPNNCGGSYKFVKAAFAPLIDAGYLAVVAGAVAPAKTLIASDKIAEVCITGGCATYDAIRWGTLDPKELAERKSKNLMAVSKDITAELGAASPWVIVPGKWTEAEMSHQVDFLVALKMFNSSAVCASPQTVIMDESWPQRDEFERRVIERLKTFPWKKLPVFYDGSVARVKAIAAMSGADVVYPNGEPTADRDSNGNRLPVQICVLRNVKANSPALTTEAFAPLLSFYSIKGGDNDASKFMLEATRVCNDLGARGAGSLSMSIMIDDRTKAANESVLQDMVKNLQWGSIGVNEWGGFSYFFAQARWGAAKNRHTAQNIQSGIGYILNARMFDHQAKSVVWGVFTSPNHQQVPSASNQKVNYRFAWFLLYPSTFRLLGVMSAALLGY